MWQKEKKDSSIFTLALLLALATTPMAAMLVTDSILAEPSSATNAALKALPHGKIDLAATGRGLTTEISQNQTSVDNDNRNATAQGQRGFGWLWLLLPLLAIGAFILWKLRSRLPVPDAPTDNAQKPNPNISLQEVPTQTTDNNVTPVNGEPVSETPSDLVDNTTQTTSHLASGVTNSTLNAVNGTTTVSNNGAAIAGGAAKAAGIGSVLWSNSSENKSELEANNHTNPISDYPEIATPESGEVPPIVETQTPQVTNVETQTPETADVTEELPAKESELENITPREDAVTGDAVQETGSGTALWQQLFDQEAEKEANDQTTEASDITTIDLWESEEVVSVQPEVTQVTASFVPHEEVAEIPLDSQQPTVEIITLSVSDEDIAAVVLDVEPSTTQVTASSVSDEDIAAVQLNVEPSTTQVTASSVSDEDIAAVQLNVEPSTTQVTASSVPDEDIAAVQLNVEPSTTQVTASSVSDEDISAVQLNVEPSTTQVTASSVPDEDIAAVQLNVEPSTTQVTASSVSDEDIAAVQLNVEPSTTQVTASSVSDEDIASVPLNVQLPTVEVIASSFAHSDITEIVSSTAQPEVGFVLLNVGLPTVEIIAESAAQKEVTEVPLNVGLPTVEIIAESAAQKEVALVAADVVPVTSSAGEPEGVAEAALDMETPVAVVNTSYPQLANIAEVAPDVELPTKVTALSASDEDVAETTLNMVADEAEEVPPSASNLQENVTTGAAVGSETDIYGIKELTQMNVKSVTEKTEEPTPDVDVQSSVVLTPRTVKWAYVSWQISEKDKQAYRQQGGFAFALRLYDVTNINLGERTPELVQQYDCEETTHDDSRPGFGDRYVAIPKSDRDYRAEVGYVTKDQQWLLLARSATVSINSPPTDFWFVADSELIIHGATQPGANVTIGGNSIKVKPDGTFHLRIPFTERLIDYLMTATAADGESITIHKKFTQETPQGEE